jgi:hypothetical protein
MENVEAERQKGSNKNRKTTRRKKIIFKKGEYNFQKKI